jgi:hypothetical protein
MWRGQTTSLLRRLVVKGFSGTQKLETRMRDPKTKKATQGGRSPAYCRCTNCPFFQDN